MLIASVSIFGARPGGVDSYEIYLNNKLLTRQFANQPLSLKSLQLNQANLNDQLVIYYSHCGTAGKGRKIIIKDEKGNTIKEWKFANASGSNTGMTIAVKDLLQLEKKHASDALSLFYTSEQLPQGRMLTGVRLSNKSTT